MSINLITLLSSTEREYDVNGVAGGHEFVEAFRLHHHVVFRDAAAHLYLLDFEVLLRDAFFLQSLTFLVAELVVVHDPRHRRFRKRGDLDEVYILRIRPLQGLLEGEYAEVRAVFV